MRRQEIVLKRCESTPSAANCFATNLERPHRRRPKPSSCRFSGQPNSSHAAEPQSRRLHPSKLLEADTVVPDLRHVTNLVAVELHHIHVVRLDALSGGWHWPTVTRMASPEHSVSGNVLSFVIDSERSNFIPPVRKRCEETFHPLRVSLQGV